LNGLFEIELGCDRRADAVEHFENLSFFLQQARRLAAGLREVKIGSHACHQLARGEGFDQVVVGTGAQALDLGFFAGTGGQQDDGDVLQLGIAAHRRQEAEAVELRHHDVGENEIGALLARHCERRDAIRDRLHAIAGRRQHSLDVLAHVRIVIRQHNEALLSLPRDWRKSDVLRPGGGKGVRRFALSIEPACGLLQVGLSANSRGYGLFTCVDAFGRQMLGAQG